MRASNFKQCQQLDDATLAQLFKGALGLRYSLPRDRFEGWITGEPSLTILSPSQVLAFVANTLAQQPDRFPPHKLTTRWLKHILVRLKALCASADDHLAGLEQFVGSRLINQPGFDVTGAELFEAYQAYIQMHSGPTLSRYEFHRRLPAVIKNNFGIPKRHDIVRAEPDGKQTNRNGWRGLQLTNTADTADGTDSIVQNVPSIETEPSL